MKEKILNLIKENPKLSLAEIHGLVSKTHGAEGLGEFHYNESFYRGYKNGYDKGVETLNVYLEKWVFDNHSHHVEPNIIEEVCRDEDYPYVNSVKLLEAISRFSAEVK